MNRPTTALPSPRDREDLTTLRRCTLERILEHINRGEVEEARAWLERCLDWDARKAQFGELMRLYRKYEHTDYPTAAAEREARDKYLALLDQLP